jgi:hypothetical protein
MYERTTDSCDGGVRWCQFVRACACMFLCMFGSVFCVAPCLCFACFCVSMCVCMCVCVCECACVRACVRACMRRGHIVRDLRAKACDEGRERVTERREKRSIYNLWRVCRPPLSRLDPGSSVPDHSRPRRSVHPHHRLNHLNVIFILVNIHETVLVFKLILLGLAHKIEQAAGGAGHGSWRADDAKHKK